MQNTRISLIVILLLIGLVLGYAIYAKLKPGNLAQPPATSQTISSPRPTLSPTQLPPWFASLSEKDKSLFNSPPQDASPSAKRNFADLIKANAKTVASLDIGKDCKASPIVLSIDKTLTFKVKNTDTIAHKIQVGPNAKYDIEAGGTSTVKLDEKGVILNLGCDLYSRVGFVLTSP